MAGQGQVRNALERRGVGLAWFGAEANTMNTTGAWAFLIIEATGLVMWLATIWMAVELLQGIVQ
jgi:hypothetical protein